MRPPRRRNTGHTWPRTPQLTGALASNAEADTGSAGHSVVRDQTSQGQQARCCTTTREDLTLSLSAAPAGRRPAGRSPQPGSGGAHQASSGTVACPPWPNGTRSWVTRAGWPPPQPSLGSWACHLRCCRFVGLPRRIPSCGPTPTAVPGLAWTGCSLPAEYSTNRRIIQSDSAGRHSPIGSFSAPANSRRIAPASISPRPLLRAEPRQIVPAFCRSRTDPAGRTRINPDHRSASTPTEQRGCGTGGSSRTHPDEAHPAETARSAVRSRPCPPGMSSSAA
jgi:hypothetical protein